RAGDPRTDFSQNKAHGLRGDRPEQISRQDRERPEETERPGGSEAGRGPGVHGEVAGAQAMGHRRSDRAKTGAARDRNLWRYAAPFAYRASGTLRKIRDRALRSLPRDR